MCWEWKEKVEGTEIKVINEKRTDVKEGKRRRQINGRR
jgi:hypothetical protein